MNAEECARAALQADRQAAIETLRLIDLELGRRFFQPTPDQPEQEVDGLTAFGERFRATLHHLVSPAERIHHLTGLPPFDLRLWLEGAATDAPDSLAVTAQLQAALHRPGDDDPYSLAEELYLLGFVTSKEITF